MSKGWAAGVVVVVLVAATVGVLALRGDDEAPQEVAADATGEAADDRTAPRCEQLGYPCTWNDVPDDLFEDTAALHDELAAAMDDAEDPEQAIAAAESILADRDDLAEWGVDSEGFGGVMFRLPGGAPSVLMTEAAAGIATEEPSELSAEELLDWTPPDLAGLLDQHGAPDAEDPPEEAGEASGPEAAAMGVAYRPASPSRGWAEFARYRPAGGPIEPKRALVLDPYPPEEWCRSGFDRVIQSGYCRVSRDGQAEGDLVAGILASHPQIDVDHLKVEEVTPAALASAGDYDLVHLVSHGLRVCGDEVDGYRRQSDERDFGGCFSAIGLGARPGSVESLQADADAARAVYDGLDFSGVTYNGTRWIVTADFFNQLGGLSDSILYVSACTSADGQVVPSNFGGFVGWHNYVELNGALHAAATFWQLMVQRGAEFEVAKAHLADRGLDTTTARNPSDPISGHTATMVAESSDNLRARDVITHGFGRALTLDRGSDADRVRRVEMLVEGVKDGTEDEVEIRMFVDGEELDERLDLIDDGRRVGGDDGVSNWMVVGEDLELPFGVDPTQEYEWESRVYEDEARYSADRDRVVFTTLRMLFESTYEQFIEGIQVLMTVEAEVPLAPTEGEEATFEAVDGGGDLELTRFEIVHPDAPCSQISASGKGTLEVSRVADLPGPLDRPDVAVNQPPSASVVYRPSTDLDTDVSITCQGVHFDSLEDAIAGMMGVPRGPIEGLEGMNVPGRGPSMPGFAGMTWYAGFSFLNETDFDGQHFTAASGPDAPSDSPWEWAEGPDGDAALERVHVGQMPDAGLTVTTTMRLVGLYPDVPPGLPEAPPSSNPGV